MSLFLTAAILSDLAYLDPEDIESEVRKFGFGNFRFIERGDIQAFMCSDEKNVHLSIRGTEFKNPEDWKTNFKFNLVPCPFGLVHEGFWEAAQSIRISVFCELIRHIVKRRKLHIDGHSQGAGIANALAIDMLADHRDIESVNTFGCPRTVDEDAANHLDTYFPNLFNRFVNNNDLVPRVPPRAFGYKHFGKLRYFEHDGDYTEDISAWERFLDRRKGEYGDFGKAGLDMIKDHERPDYIRLVRSAEALL